MGVNSQGVHLHKLAQLFPAIADLITDDAVTEIMVTSHPSRGVLVFFEKKGKLYRAPLTGISRSHVLSFCMAASRPLGSNLKEEPLIDARLADGSRVAIAVPPASPNGPAVTIRRFAKVAYTGMDLVKFGSLPKAVFDMLVHALTHGGNVLVAGGTGSGKTTLLNALLAEFPADDRLVVIEDVIELKIDQPNVVRLEARSGGKGALSPRHMVKHALRQRPDHIVLGEVRGEEAYDVLQALNTGHGGSMTTIHANSAENALLRLASCALEGTDMPWSVVAGNVAMAFDLIVHQERRADRSRGVSEVIRVKGYDRVREVWDVDRVWQYSPTGAEAAVEAFQGKAAVGSAAPPASVSPDAPAVAAVSAPAAVAPVSAPPVLPAAAARVAPIASAASDTRQPVVAPVPAVAGAVAHRPAAPAAAAAPVVAGAALPVSAAGDQRSVGQSSSRSPSSRPVAPSASGPPARSSAPASRSSSSSAAAQRPQGPPGSAARGVPARPAPPAPRRPAPRPSAGADRDVAVAGSQSGAASTAPAGAAARRPAPAGAGPSPGGAPSADGAAERSVDPSVAGAGLRRKHA